MPTNKGTHAGFYTSIQAPKVDIRNELGQFTSAQKQLYAQNRALAISIQQQVARFIDANIIRQKVKSGRLVNATLHPKNATFGYDHVGVGNEDYLNKSIAKYWRTIEEGSAATWTKRSFLSLELQGIWGLNVREGRWNTSAAGNEWSSLGGTAEKSRGHTGARQEMYQPLRRGRHGRPSGLPIFHPGHEIRPMRAYEYVAKNPATTAAAIEHGRQFVERFMKRGITPSGFRGGIYDHGGG